MTGKKYEYTTIRGCCQGDWQIMYYPTEEYSNEFIKCFEIEYFNMGTEWIIHDEDFEPKSADEISGYSVYCYTYDPIEEIAREHGIITNDVIAYEVDGYSRVTKYKLIAV